MRRLRLHAVVVMTVATMAALTTVPNGPATAASTTTDVTLHVATNVPHKKLNRDVAGVVMNFAVYPNTSPSLGSAIGLHSGRYALYPADYGNANMPEACWTDSASDWSKVDSELGTAIGLGMDPAKLEVQLVYISPCLSPIGNLTGVDALSAYPSVAAAAIEANPGGVRQQIYQQIGYLAQRWGVRIFGAWNEPNGIFPLAESVYNDYYALVDSALRQVEAEQHVRLFIAGPETSGIEDGYFIPPFLDFVGQNHLDFDYFTFHDYADTNGGVTTSSQEVGRIGRIRGWLSDAQALYPWLQPRLSMDEWNWNGGGGPPGTAIAPFAASTLTTIIDLGLDRADFFNWQDIPVSTTNASSVGYGNLQYGLLDKSEQPKAAFHLFEFFHQMGDERVQASPVAADLGGSQEWGALATQTDAGDLTLLIRYWDPQKSGGTIHVNLDLTGFVPASWEAQAVGVPTNGSVVTSSGTGLPSVELPANEAMLITLHPATTG